jgi:hypothetical protein
MPALPGMIDDRGVLLTSNHASSFPGKVGRRSVSRNPWLTIVQFSVLSALAFAVGLMSVNARGGDDAAEREPVGDVTTTVIAAARDGLIALRAINPPLPPTPL